MKVLVIGSGGRCHAIVDALAKSPEVEKIYCAPGNAGIAAEAQCVAIADTDAEALADFAERNEIGLTVVGPEAALDRGVADCFKRKNLRIFGPTKAAARIESSKEFAKRLMTEHGVPTAAYRTFTDYAAAVERVSGRASVPGNFVDADGKVLGTHRGVIHYTIGQRRGLGVSAPERLYVRAISAKDNTVTLGTKDTLLRAWIGVGAFYWISGEVPNIPFRCGVKLRSTQKELPVIVFPAGLNRVRVVFDEPQPVPAPGQAAVLYDGDTVLGGGVILPSD